MSDQPEAELRDRGENLVVGCLALGGVGVPVWLLMFVTFQSVYVQSVAGSVIPELRGLLDGDEVARQIVWQLNTDPITLIMSAFVATAITVPAVVAGAVLVGGGGFLSAWIGRLRDQAARRRYDAMVGTVVMAPDAWPAAPAPAAPTPAAAPASPPTETPAPDQRPPD